MDRPSEDRDFETGPNEPVLVEFAEVVRELRAREFLITQRWLVSREVERQTVVSLSAGKAGESVVGLGEWHPLIARSNLVVATGAAHPNAGEALAGVVPFSLCLEDFVAPSTPRIWAENPIVIVGREEARAHRAGKVTAGERSLTRAMSLTEDLSFRVIHWFEDTEGPSV